MTAPKNDPAKALLRKKFEDVLATALDETDVYGTFGITFVVVNSALQKCTAHNDTEHRLPKVNPAA